MKKANFKVGDKVFAKVKGYPPWPAQIVGENGKKYNVKFYGTGETGAIKVEDLFYYLKNKEKFQKPLKRKDYLDAFEQIEEAIKIDGGDGNAEPNIDDSTIDKDISVNISTSSLNSSQKATKKTTLKRKRSLDKSATEPPKKINVSKSIEADSKNIVEPEEPAIKKSSKNETTIEKEKNEDQDDLKDKSVNESSESVQRKVEKSPEKSEEIKTDAISDSFELDLDVVSEQFLKNNIIYIVWSYFPNNQEKMSSPQLNFKQYMQMLFQGKHVQDFKQINTEKPPEPREDHINQILPVKLPSGKMGGIKLHLKWPLNFDNEFSRALYDETTAVRVLEQEQKILAGDTTIVNDEESFIADIKMTAEDIKQILYLKDIECKKEKINRLKLESDLSVLDSKIKSCLGLEEANPKEALVYLEDMCRMEFDEIMLKKHAHVVEVVRRLRKYVGNTMEWNLSQDSLVEFSSQAAKVREKAEEVYCKFKEIMKLPPTSTSFWDGFSEIVSKFKAKCKDLTHSQIYILCAEPGSRKAFLDKLDEESSGKENYSGVANVDAENNVNGSPKETSSQAS